MTLSWFDDVIDLVPWDHVPAGYIQLSAIYDHAAEEALRRAWAGQADAGNRTFIRLYSRMKRRQRFKQSAANWFNAVASA